MCLFPERRASSRVRGYSVTASSASASAYVRNVSIYAALRLKACAHMQSASGRGQDFSALQQHIDELTTAKFELQRGMAQQGKLAASLAAENMRLGEDFNQQVLRSL